MKKQLRNRDFTLCL